MYRFSFAHRDRLKNTIYTKEHRRANPKMRIESKVPMPPCALALACAKFASQETRLAAARKHRETQKVWPTTGQSWKDMTKHAPPVAGPMGNPGRIPDLIEGFPIDVDE